jgi:hypothetical protein
MSEPWRIYRVLVVAIGHQGLLNGQVAIEGHVALESPVVVWNRGASQEIFEVVRLSVPAPLDPAIVEEVEAVEDVEGGGVLSERLLEFSFPAPLRAVLHLLGDGEDARPARVEERLAPGALDAFIAGRLVQYDLGKWISGMPIVIRGSDVIAGAVPFPPVVVVHCAHLIRFRFKASAWPCALHRSAYGPPRVIDVVVSTT